MEQLLMERCEQFAENKEALRTGFKLEHTAMYALCAIVCGNKKVNIQRIKDCKKIIKEQTSVFSTFRSHTFLVLATMLSLEDDPQSRMADILDTYSVFKKNKFWGSDFLALSSFLIRETDHERKQWLVEKSREIYKLAKENHPFLTASEDYGYTVMLALSEQSAKDAILETEHCYDFLKNHFLSKDAVQSLSFVLALGTDTAEEKCDKAMRIFETLKQNGYKYGTGYELPGLGVLTLSANNEDQTVANVMGVYDYLKTQKGFGSLAMGRAQRVLFASALTVQDAVSGDTVLNTTLTNTVTNIIIAIEIALMAAVVASTAAVTSSSNS